MIHFKFTDKDPRYLFLKYDKASDRTALIHLRDQVMNLTDPVCYLHSYKGFPFTQDFLWEYHRKDGSSIFYCAIGLWQTIWKWFKENNIEYDGLDEKYLKREVPGTYEEFIDYVDSWKLSRTPRPYQYEAAWKILHWKKSVSQLATRAGKTLIAYIVFRYAMEKLGVRRILMIVPSIDLVKQGYSDFNEYGEFFKGECLWGGGKVVESSNLTIATFQTLVNFLDPKSKKYNPSFFSGNGIDLLPYDMVFVDETHRANAQSIKNIISQPFMQNVKVAFGMTGTLPKEKTIQRHCINALLGAKIQEIAPKELMDSGYISPVNITQHRIKYANQEKELDNWLKCAEYSLSQFVTIPNKNNPKKQEKVPLNNPQFLVAFQKTLPQGVIDAKYRLLARKDMSDVDKKIALRNVYRALMKDSTAATALHTEQMMVHFMEERIDYLIEVLKKCPKNTLVLAQYREYITHVYERVKKTFPERKVLMVIGGSKDRKTVKQQLAETNSGILIAGYSIMGTGITLPNLCHGILFESFKSGVINMQSIGRGLGLTEQKEVYDLHDFTDDFDKDVTSNKIFLQGLERIKIYKENQYPYTIKDVTIGENHQIIYKEEKKAKPKKKKETKKVEDVDQLLFKM